MTDTTERAEALPLVLEFTSTMDGKPAAVITNTETQGGAWVYSDTDPFTFAMLRTQAERIASLEAERDKLRAEVERLRGERMVFIELVRDLLHVVDTIQPQSDDTIEVEMLDALTTMARSAIEGALRAIESAKEQK